MGISGVSAISGYSGIDALSLYPLYNTSAVNGVRRAQAVTPGTDGTAQAAVDGVRDAEKDKKVKQAECQTCKNRKYVDGSNEGDVSFKAPAHISPQMSASAVMSHEQEHVSNAIAKGNREDTQLLSVSVSLQTAVCPECGRVYTAGGVTHSTFRTSKSSENTNPYEQQRANLRYLMASGANLDMSA